MGLADRVVSTGTSDTPTSSDDNKIVRITSTAGAFTLVVDTEANQSWDDEVLYVERATSQTVGVSPASGVTIYLPDGQTITSGTVVFIAQQNGLVALRHQGSGSDDWTLSGDIGLVYSVPAVATDDITVGPEHIDAITRVAKTTAVEVEFVEDDDIPVGASGEIVQWGNGPLSLTATGVVLVSLDADLTLSGLYASIVWTKLDATTYFIRGALAVERTMTWDGVEIATNVWSTPGFCAQEFATSAMTADRLYFSPFWLVDPVLFTGVEVQVTSGAGTVLRVGLVKLDEDDWQPNATGLIGQTTFDPSTTGTKQDTGIAWSADEPGLYSWVWVSDGAPTLRVVRGAYTAGHGVSGALLPMEMPYKSGVGSSAFSDPVPDWTDLADNAAPRMAIAALWEAA